MRDHPAATHGTPQAAVLRRRQCQASSQQTRLPLPPLGSPVQLWPVHLCTLDTQGQPATDRYITEQVMHNHQGMFSTFGTFHHSFTPTPTHLHKTCISRQASPIANTVLRGKE